MESDRFPVAELMVCDETLLYVVVDGVVILIESIYLSGFNNRLSSAILRASVNATYNRFGT